MYLKTQQKESNSLDQIYLILVIFQFKQSRIIKIIIPLRNFF